MPFWIVVPLFFIGVCAAMIDWWSTVRRINRLERRVDRLYRETAHYLVED